MAINITKVIEEIQKRLHNASSSTSTQDLIDLVKASKKGDGSLIFQYDSAGLVPAASSTDKRLIFVSNLGELKFNNNNNWDNLPDETDIEATGSSFVFQGETTGYISGGDGVTNKIESYSLVSDGNATDTGYDLSVGRNNTAGAFSKTFAYTAGGITPTLSNVIDKFPFASIANATDVGDLFAAVGNISGHSTDGYGYVSGGASPTYLNTIQKFSTSADANGTDVGDLVVNRFYKGGDQSSSTYGYVSGGFTGSVTTNAIDKWPFTSDANATDVGDITVTRYSATGSSSSTTYGYMAGGFAPPNSNVIDKFPFASDANSSDVGDLTVARQNGAPGSSTTHGYSLGGNGTTMDKYAFASDGNATSVGTTSTTVSGAAGQHI